jgi:hypothetical protein
MRIIRNERRIRRSSFIGKYATLAGLLTLIAGMVISFARPDWLTAMLVSIIVGISLSALGGFFAERYVGPFAHHDTLVKALKGMDDSYMLLQYVLPTSHVLLEPGGCTVFVVKVQGGQVTYEDGRWKHRQRGKFFRQLAGQEAAGAPDSDAERQMRRFERWLASQLPDVEVPVRAVIVFVNPRVKLDADTSPVPAFYGKKVKAWLRGPGRLKPLPDDVYRQLTAALEATA